MFSVKALLRVGWWPLAAGLLFSAGCGKKGDVSTHLAEAEKAFQERQFEKAKIEYINAARLNPTNEHVIRQVGKILVEQGQLGPAFPLLMRASQKFPDDVEVRESLALVYARAGGETNRARLRTELDEILKRQATNETAVLLLTEQARTPEEAAALQRRIAELRARNGGEHVVFLLSDADRVRRQGDTNGCEALLKKAVALDPKSPIANQSYGNFLALSGRKAEGEKYLRTAAEVSPPHGVARQILAQFLIGEGRLDEAKKVLEDITARAPERTRSWVMRAEIANAEKKFDEADRNLDRALQQAPEDLEAFRVRSQVRLAQGKAEAAIEDLERVLKLAPGSAEIYAQLGVAHLLNRDQARAVAALQQAITIAPTYSPASMLLAQVHSQRGETDQALLVLRETVRRNPGLIQAHVQLASTEVAVGRLDDALETARNARTRFPKDADVALQLALIQRRLGQTAEARQNLESAMTLSTNNLAAFEQLVQLDVEKGDRDGALKKVQARLSQEPKEPLLWLVLAEIHRNRQETTESEKALRKVLELDPDSSTALMSLANLYLSTKRENEAIAELEKSIQVNPNDARALTLLAMIQAERKEYTKASDYYDQALKLRPNNPLVLNNQAYLLVERLGKTEEGYRLAQKARELSPKDPLIADTLGWIEYRRGKYSDALRLITEAATKLGQSGELQYHLGMAHYMMGQEAAARTALEVATQAKEEFEGKATAREHLALLTSAPGAIDAAAIESLEKRRQSAPNDVIALTRLGFAYETSQNYEKAKDAYESVLKVNPQSITVLTRLAGVYASKLGNIPRAAELSRTASTLAPNDPEVSYLAGRIALAGSDQAVAYGLLQTAARRLTNRVDVTHDLGMAAFNQGNIDEATRIMEGVATSTAPGAKPYAESARRFLTFLTITKNPAAAPQAASEIQKALQADPAYAPALLAYGVLAEQQSKFTEAKDAYERLLGRYPGFGPATRLLCLLYADRLNNDAKAFELGTKARQVYPRDEALAAAIGKVAARRGDHRYAIQLLNEASAKRADDASLFYHLGIAYIAAKQPTEAKTALEKSLKLAADAPFAADAKKRLEDLGKTK
ncbi:MAG: tetratricopeptide repeat protein [Verrucomicrobiales bacterium]|nr:tetratricopeptide repeat protein [Verrucomicrobiales bacterium]